jgi:mono/diheme cytochrome c family protein
MRRLTAGGLCLASFLLLARDTGVTAGAAAPFAGRIHAALTRSAGSDQKTAVALVFGDMSCDRMADLRALKAGLATHGTVLVAVARVPEPRLDRACPEALGDLTILYDAGGEISRAYGAINNRVAFLIDDNGIVRRVVRPPDRLVQQVAAWTDGKAVYDAQCARCHGADGRDESYPGVKSLAGIGNRISEGEILHRTALTGAVDMSGWTESQRRALAAYVAGL